MAEKKFLKGSEEWMKFMDYWNLCQKFWDPEDNDAYWEQVVTETNSFYEKYHTELDRAWAGDLVTYLEKKMRGSGK